MNIQGKPYQTIWEKKEDEEVIQIIDQRRLPFEFVVEELKHPDDYAFAIREMMVRGAPLIGVTAAYGMYSASLNTNGRSDRKAYIREVADQLKRTRPTAIDLFYAVERSLEAILKHEKKKDQVESALKVARDMWHESIEACQLIGRNGLTLIKELSEKKKGGRVNILTHCNAGWLACIDYGTATAPIYMAHDLGYDVHVWVDETRPRSQGAKLTAFELAEHGVPHTVIADNTGGHLMQHRMVDMVIVGTDRTTRRGDVANKIGTYLKALAASDNNVPFYVALPSSSIDWDILDGVKEIPIEERNEEEVTHMSGWDGEKVADVRIMPANSPALNFGFDVTPAKYVTGLITDRGICRASEEGLLGLFPERK